MKRNGIIALAAAFAVTFTASSLFVSGDEVTYDPQNDPLITLSYVEQVLTPMYLTKINEVSTKVDSSIETVKTLQASLTKAEGDLSALQTKNAELEAKLAEIEAKIGAEDSGSASAASAQYQVVYMKKGAKLLAKSPCELILRAGTGIVISITANGINDFSNGTELMNAAEVPLFHGLLIPRGGDGRGIEITSEEAYIMVRGEYEIVE